MRDLSVLRSFVAVVDHGSVAVAARMCGYSAPAVSRHIGGLERELEMTLFERTGRSIRPSVAARALAERARLLLEEAEEFDREARALATGEIGVVRLAYFRAAGSTIVPPALAVFEALRPGARVTLIECELTGDVEALLRNREADLGFVWGFPEPQASDLVTSLLFREGLVLMTSIDRDDLHESPRDLSRLTGEAFASAPRHAGAPPVIDRLFESYGLPRPTVTHRPTDHAMLRSLVASGLVVNLVPALGVSEAAPGVRRSVALPDFRCTYLSWPDGTVNPLVDTMVRAIRIAAAEFSGFGVEYAG
jgi:DNA-binding transcriptional LysR family regulator